MEKQIQHFRISAKESKDVKLILEPWGEEFLITEEDSFKITIHSPINSDWHPELVFYRNQSIALMCRDGGDYFYQIENHGVVIRDSNFYLS